MVVSVHIPKCAGTSFRRVLNELCAARTWCNYGANFSKDDAWAGLIPAGTEVIHGHFIADAFEGLFPRRRLITWVRHPVERRALKLIPLPEVARHPRLQAARRL